MSERLVNLFWTLFQRNIDLIRSTVDNSRARADGQPNCSVQLKRMPRVKIKIISEPLTEAERKQINQKLAEMKEIADTGLVLEDLMFTEMGPAILVSFEPLPTEAREATFRGICGFCQRPYEITRAISAIGPIKKEKKTGRRYREIEGGIADCTCLSYDGVTTRGVTLFAKEYLPD